MAVSYDGACDAASITDRSVGYQRSAAYGKPAGMDKGPAAPTNWREGRRVRAVALHERGWTGKAIDDALGVTPGAVSQWLSRARTGGAVFISC